MLNDPSMTTKQWVNKMVMDEQDIFDIGSDHRMLWVDFSIPSPIIPHAPLKHSSNSGTYLRTQTGSKVSSKIDSVV